MTMTIDERPMAVMDGPVGQTRIQPMRALRAIRKLIADKEDTQQVFEIIQALSGKAITRGYNRMLSSEIGGREAYLRRELGEYFDDPAWRAQFAEGTVGAAYRAFRAERDLDVMGLAAEARKVNEMVEAAHPIAWYARRLSDVHDIWHTITGYGTDALGEASLLAFTYAQTRNRAIAFIVLAAVNEFRKTGYKHPYGRAILEGYRHGRRAAQLIDQDYLALFAEPLDAARARLRIEEPKVYFSIPKDARNAYGDIMVPVAA